MPTSSLPGAIDLWVVRRSERLQAGVTALALLGTWLLGTGNQMAAVFTASLVGWLNLRALAWLALRLVGGQTDHKNSAIFLMLAKFALLAGLIGAIWHVIHPDPLTFLLALTLMPACLAATAVLGRRTAATAAVEVR